MGYGGICFLLIRDDFPSPADPRNLVDIDSNVVEKIRTLPSFLHMEIFVQAGTTVSCTVDCFTFGGLVVLAHKNCDQYNDDFKIVTEIDRMGAFFIF